MLTRVTMTPDTVQTEAVVETKLMASPEDAVAPIANGAVPNIWLAMGPNVMVWFPGVMVS